MIDFSDIGEYIECDTQGKWLYPLTLKNDTPERIRKEFEDIQELLYPEADENGNIPQY